MCRFWPPTNMCRFLRGPNGLPQVVMNGPTGPVLVEGNLNAPLDLTNALRTGHAFLDDIAHTANPYMAVNGVATLRTADLDSTAGHHLNQVGDDGLDMANTNSPQRGGSANYDNELLDSHYITGDGRGNENIGLTAVHHIFHSEHNRLAESVKELALSSNNLAFLNEWLLVTQRRSQPRRRRLKTSCGTVNACSKPPASAPRCSISISCSKSSRARSSTVDLFVFNPTMDINPAIFAEFAHVVYRFGHSMLNETVDRLGIDGQTSDDILLFDAFLNPIEFTEGGTLTAEQAAGDIIAA